MIIDQNKLANMYITFNALFNEALQATQPWWERVAMLVRASTRIVDYKWLKNFPGIQEWIGDRQIQSLEAEAFQIEAKKYEGTVEVEEDDIEDDTLGIYSPLVSELGRAAKKHPDRLIGALIAAGLTATIWDGKHFFDTDHPAPVPTNEAAVASNYTDGAGTPWYLLDVSRAIKPFIFQLRRDWRLVRMDKEDDEEKFMRGKIRYGVDYRSNVGFGLWQLAHCSKAVLSGDNFGAVRAAMMSLKNVRGEALDITPNLLVVPPSLEGKARELLNNQFIIGDATAGGSKENVWKGTADLLVIQDLAA
jgi:phage major head subunit gpT-like protein